MGIKVTTGRERQWLKTTNLQLCSAVVGPEHRLNKRLHLYREAQHQSDACDYSTSRCCQLQQYTGKCQEHWRQRVAKKLHHSIFQFLQKNCISLSFAATFKKSWQTHSAQGKSDEIILGASRPDFPSWTGLKAFEILFGPNSGQFDSVS